MIRSRGLGSGFAGDGIDAAPFAGHAAPVRDRETGTASFVLIDRGGGRVDGIASGFDRRRLRELRRGEPPPDREVELHGLRRDEAQRVLSAELLEAIAAGARCVLVIHGRGTRSPAGPVLRSSLPAWLAEPPHGPCVLAFAASENHAGGATYVLLRRSR